MNSHQESILIVDDIPTNIKVLFDFLTQSGFRISIAKSGESALEKVLESAPNLILLDVLMPGINGFETCRRLKENPATRDIPIIFMTALTDAVNKVEGLSLGAVDYITKPFQQEEVLARINIHLELRRTQLKLIQEEKMASLGQLVAGVAHEINNPVNFIEGNLLHAQTYVSKLLKLIHIYEANMPCPIPEAEDFAAQIDLDFLKQDLPKLIDSMETGTQRIQEIVRSLRIFSRLDEAECKPVNLHEGIDSTLMILNSRLKGTPPCPAIAVIKNYGDIPQVECYAGQINQVFMNVLVNAIDVIEETFGATPEMGSSCSKPTIRIETEISSDATKVLIRIADNGRGMPSEIQQRIYDQFFTTKSIGKGTGLGLAISHSIVKEKHGGQLTCQSKVGEGTEFTIVLPIEQVVDSLSQ